MAKPKMEPGLSSGSRKRQPQGEPSRRGNCKSFLRTGPGFAFTLLLLLAAWARCNRADEGILQATGHRAQLLQAELRLARQRPQRLDLSVRIISTRCKPIPNGSPLRLPVRPAEVRALELIRGNTSSST